MLHRFLTLLKNNHRRGRYAGNVRFIAAPYRAPRGSRGSNQGVPGDCQKHATGRTASRPTEVESASAHDFPSDWVGIRSRWIDRGPAGQGTEPILTPLEHIPD